MRRLVQAVEELRQLPVKNLVNARIQEFKALGRRPGKELFKELCFCILTANFDAGKSIAIQEKVCNGFLDLNAKQLEKRLRQLGYRYPNRAAFIEQGRKHIGALKKAVAFPENEFQAREWLVQNFKGLGMKEASHFLRNIGFQNVAIIDFHIVDLLLRHKLIERPKTMTRKRYLEIEKVLGKMAEGLGMSLAELDLYLWHLETGKVLK